MNLELKNHESSKYYSIIQIYQTPMYRFLSICSGNKIWDIVFAVPIIEAGSLWLQWLILRLDNWRRVKSNKVMYIRENIENKKYINTLWTSQRVVRKSYVTLDIKYLLVLVTVNKILQKMLQPQTLNLIIWSPISSDTSGFPDSVTPENKCIIITIVYDVVVS